MKLIEHWKSSNWTCLQMEPSCVRVVLEDDGTLVDSNTFFQKLPAQTVLVFLKPGDHWGGGT